MTTLGLYCSTVATITKRLTTHTFFHYFSYECPKGKGTIDEVDFAPVLLHLFHVFLPSVANYFPVTLDHTAVSFRMTRR